MKKNKILAIISLSFLLAHSTNIYYLYEILFHTKVDLNDTFYGKNYYKYEKFKKENRITFLQEKAHFIRYNKTKNEDDLKYVLSKILLFENYGDTRKKILKIALLGQKNHNSNWLIYHLIARLSLGEELKQEEKQKIIEQLNDNTLTVKAIENTICKYNIYNKNTEFLKPFFKEYKGYLKIYGETSYECKF